MKSLDIHAVSRIASDAARRVSSALTVVGVTVGAGGTDYVEIVLDVIDLQTPSSRIIVGAFRNVEEEVLRAELARQLQDRLARHG